MEIIDKTFQIDAQTSSWEKSNTGHHGHEKDSVELHSSPKENMLFQPIILLLSGYLSWTIVISNWLSN